MATIKQKKAAGFIAEGDSVSKAMTKAGYSPNSAKNPSELTESKGFAKILEKAGITDDILARKLNEGMEANATAFVKGEGFIQTDFPDHNTRHKFIETNLRLRGHSKDAAPSVVVVPIYAGRSTE